MSSVVVIFLPGVKTGDELAAVLRRFADAAETIDVSVDDSRETIQDADQLPLWQWFTF